jgi:DNA-binding transcriptional LysR family regulator
MDLFKSIQAYVATVEAGSLVDAAEQLGTSNAAVSRYLAALEEHLGARLLNRTTRRLSMTAAGQDFYNRAQTILADIAEAEAVAGATTSSPSGLLRISAPLSFGIGTLSQIMPGFLARYPDLRMDIDLTDRVTDLTNDGIDVAVRIAREPATTNVIARKIAPVKMIICAAPSYLKQRGIPKGPEDLQHYETLNYSYLSSGDNWTLTHSDGRQSIVRIKPRVHATNGDILRELAIASHGIIMQPDFIVSAALQSGALEPILVDWSIEGYHLYAVYLSRKFLSAKVRAFIDYLIGAFGESAAGSL